MKKRWIFVLIFMLVILISILVFNYNKKDNNKENNSQIANPASVYCEERGGTSEIRTSPDGSQTGYCIFSNGSECEEWSYYRGECNLEGKE